MQLISPGFAVFEMAPGKVLHGAVRLHGLASSPTPETQVRVACAEAGETNDGAVAALAISAPNMKCFITPSYVENVWLTRRLSWSNPGLKSRPSGSFGDQTAYQFEEAIAGGCRVAIAVLSDRLCTVLLS